MTFAIIGRWGKSLGLRLPVEISERLSVREGDRFEFDTSEDQIVLRRPLPRYRLDDLFAAKSAQEWRADYADSYDWGDDVGREAIEE